MTIDFHTHIFPDTIAQRALLQLKENAHTYAHIYGEAVSHTNATANGLLVSSKAANVDISVVMPIATSPRPTETLNNFAALVNKRPGLRSFGSVHPRSPEAMRELERVQELGLRGVKLHPEYQGCFADEPEMIAVVKRAAELGLWVLFHAGKDIGMPLPVHCAPKQVKRLREAVPEANIILAHMGGFCLWEDVEKELSDLNVYVDTSYSFPNFPNQWERFARLIKALGTDHVLFGTDSPWSDQASTVQVMQEFFEKYHFKKEEADAILGGNAAKILEIDI